VAWYDDSSLYYGAPAEVLAQGDIVVATTGVFEGEHGDVSPASPLYFGEERLVQVWLGSTHTLPEAPSLGLRARWGLAMVLPHACALEKEFNERVAVLVAAMRLATLSSIAQAHLQAALAKHWAYRDLSRYDELQRAFGQRITAVVPISTGKKMRVGFTLEDGAQLVFEASDKPLPPPNPPTRRPRPSRS